MDQPNFLDNKYTRWYYKIIENADSTSSYVERHHIIPRSLGGSNAKSNIVALSARQHLVCHLLLVKMTTGRARFKMICAAHHMSVQARYKLSSNTYERLKRQRSESMKGNTYGRGFRWTAEQRQRLSKSLKTSDALQNRGKTWRQHISEAQSRGVLLINAKTNEIVGEWPNCTKLAEYLDCTRANVKAAVRNGTCVGRKLSKLKHTPHFVKWVKL